ncbi:BTAD domain-containing putative transcriptional regulator [Micromonospora mirobrigensis]|uniref:DNA-binding transcriptional activator of the SARP family n=1 Tax=Micromonospora mirobrigensis TaxID=262898 RepID=A0A1C4YAC4_9ACTN|nr:BTAD domain-containing putative transcriptional regulator [Micromonospora mirobrigensis]SCF17668.1 DNA-binding transcriptional activator of the SARP family [Micromonospora mirobrigensis]
MSEALRFQVLGPQRAWYADRPLDLGPGKQRAVLTVLLLAAGRPVPTGQIVEAVWPDDPPANGANVVQKYVAGLRRVLEPERSPRTPGQVLALTDAGYRLNVPPEAVDAIRFERGVHRARQRHAAGRSDEALADITDALELWRGEPFGGHTGPYFEAARSRLVELRAVALETRAELELATGRHRELVGELVELVAEFPVRERLRHHLMLALYRGGRQAEALAAYRDFAGLLREEYGIQPGAALQDLHGRMLRSDPTLASAVPDPRPPAPRVAPGEVGGEPVPPQRSPDRPAPAAADLHRSVPPTPDLHRSFLTAPLGAAAGSVATGAADRAAVASPAEPRRGDPPKRWVSHLGTVLAAATVLLSFGTLAWMVLLFYAIRRRRAWLFVAAAAYFAAFLLFAVGMDLSEISDPDAPPSTLDSLAIIGLGAAWVGGTGHVVLLNRRVAEALHRGADQPETDERRIRREQTRYLLDHYPPARHELRIGRPDLPRTFDDGGLVDINAVDDAVLAALPGLTDEQRRLIVADRRQRGPYGSVEELGGRCGLPAAVTGRLRDVLIFLPSWQETA